jgi:hypothetical protein
MHHEERIADHVAGTLLLIEVGRVREYVAGVVAIYRDWLRLEQPALTEREITHRAVALVDAVHERVIAMHAAGAGRTGRT